MTRAALVKFIRAWLPELICAAILSVFILIRAKDGTLFVVFEAIVLAAGWAMGHRHRRLPMQATLDGVKQDVRQVRDILVDMADDAEAEAPSGAPDLKLVR